MVRARRLVARPVARLLAACLLAPLLAACAPGPAAPTPRIMVPNAPGGGYDTTARMLAGVWKETGAVADAEVFNLPGAGGVVGLARLGREVGNADLVMMMGLGVVGAVQAGDHGVGFGDVTPVARILSEPNVVLVRADSPVRSLGDLTRRWRRRPASVLVGGGSLPGGPDHLATFELARAVDVPAARVRYRRYDGGGPLLAALLSGQVDVVMSGVLETIDQLRSGSVRALAVTGGRRLPDVDAPTLQQAGVDVVFENWRGLLAPPGLSGAERDRLVDLVRAAMGTPQWRRAEERNGWLPQLLVGDEFAAFLSAEVRRTERLLDSVPPVEQPRGAAS